MNQGDVFLHRRMDGFVTIGCSRDCDAPVDQIPYLPYTDPEDRRTIDLAALVEWADSHEQEFHAPPPEPEKEPEAPPEPKAAKPEPGPVQTALVKAVKDAAADDKVTARPPATKAADE